MNLIYNWFVQNISKNLLDNNHWEIFLFVCYLSRELDFDVIPSGLVFEFYCCIILQLFITWCY